MVIFITDVSVTAYHWNISQFLWILKLSSWNEHIRLVQMKPAWGLFRARSRERPFKIVSMDPEASIPLMHELMDCPWKELPGVLLEPVHRFGNDVFVWLESLSLYLSWGAKHMERNMLVGRSCLEDGAAPSSTWSAACLDSSGHCHVMQWLPLWPSRVSFSWWWYRCLRGFHGSAVHCWWCQGLSVPASVVHLCSV